ncbi:hypothetical protein HKI87_15g81140 [Chloropicon roscoffensis]|uniref:Uncharacterized protein n=2 Tax=Chloropicon roscoffensis TaxID=1461544 RepID=A0AAX4PJG7_9CHLO
MTTTTQVWHTYERIVHETLEGSERLLEEEDGQDYSVIMKDLRRQWELKLIESGALALGVEVDPNSQKAMGKGPEVAVKREEPSTSPRAAAPAAQAGSKRQKPSEEEAGGDGDAQGEGSQPPAKRVKSEVEAPSRPSRPMPTTMEAVEDIDLADLDDELDEMMGGAGDDTTKDVVLAQVEKKFKSKNKYRFQFRAGIMQIDGLEYVFERGSGDFKW